MRGEELMESGTFHFSSGGHDRNQGEEWHAYHRGLGGGTAGGRYQSAMTSLVCSSCHDGPPFYFAWRRCYGRPLYTILSGLA